MNFVLLISLLHSILLFIYFYTTFCAPSLSTSEINTNKSLEQQHRLDPYKRSLLYFFSFEIIHYKIDLLCREIIVCLYSVIRIVCRGVEVHLYLLSMEVARQVGNCRFASDLFTKSKFQSIPTQELYIPITNSPNILFIYYVVPAYRSLFRARCVGASLMSFSL